MTEPSQFFTCHIDSLGYKGEGICRLDGRVVFVPHALPGEQVEININRFRKKLAFADLVQVITPSKHRVQPLCPHVGTCGGCAAQHMDEALQQAFKQQTVKDNLRRISGLSLDVQPIITAGEAYYYRNKTTWQVLWDQDGYHAGFFKAGTHEVVPVGRCAIASHPSNAAKAAVVSWLNACREQGISLPLRQFTTRSNQAGQLMLVLHGMSSPLPLQDLLINELQKAAPGLVSICLSAQAEADDEALQTGSIQVIYGTPLLKETLMGLDFQISPLSFFQVNHAVCELLYAHALQQAVKNPEDVVLDLYAGAGTISLAAARRCRLVAGIEYAEEAVQDAQENARINGIQNAVFHAGKAENVLPELVAAGFKPDAVIMDPPRKGAHPEVLKAIAGAQPERVVYISCHPASQARDAAVLASAGYTATLAQPFDMFPQTAEIENIITFERNRP